VDAFSRRHLLGATGALAAMSAFGPEAWAQAKDRLVIGMSLEPPVLDPTKNAAAAIREVTTPNIYESLGRIDRNGAIGPGLAQSWNISEDGKEYVFKIRQGVKFHDGEPLDAAIVKFSLDRLFAADSTNPAKSLYTDIDKVEVVDPSTVKVTLKSPNSFLLYSLSLGDSAIMTPKTAPTNDKNPIGTGPFMFKERKEGDSITLVKSPTYRDPGSIKLNTVIFKIVKDPSAQVSALLAGDIDAFQAFQAPELVERLKKDARFVVVIGTTEGEVILATNNSKKPYSDPKVRQAVAHALNREELISAESGYGVPIGSHFAPHNKAYVDLTKTYPFDIAKAKALLAEAGYPNGFEASLKLPPVGYAQRAGEVLANQLGKVGIKVSIAQLQWPQWLSEVFKERNYDFTVVAHTEANDLDRYARDGYYWAYDSAAFKAKWREVVAATDFAKRDALLKEAQTIIAKDAVNGFLYQLAKIGVWKKELVGMWENDPSPSADFSGVHWK
jgi:peptide/nickel transport system substrate-binding protein